jgi:hypothetical protein
MTRQTSIAFTAILAASVLGMTAPAFAAADPNNPDWPCVQKKVENLSPTAIWAGPPIDNVKDWARDEKVAALVRTLAARKVPIDKATAAVKEYAASIPEADRNAALTKVFTGLFETVNGQRRSVVNGIEKFQRAQKARAEELEKQGVDIAKLSEGGLVVDDTSGGEPSKEEQEQYWASRIFQERQQSIPIACELPAVFETRLFELSNAIQAELKK